ncbi:GRIP1-associated protein 1-like isoform X1 [Anneissia japonica]|uniref:GRIP1-associated protein 1-like isoform X1 n=1 Tax=Anneissia japonica TaxID=1529436 RepID=UPI0014254B89|nr:GRIP1-associated protein 1-like isoform X1 [Anneissia japonica]
MAQSLSDEEFNRMQAQLLELRTTNYQQSDQIRKYENELSTLQSRSSSLEKDLQKANKIISKSKKAKEVEVLIIENESLQRKLQSQEEDFRLQNSTLMQELSKLCTSNEELENEVKGLRQGKPTSQTGTTESSELADEVRRLQAHNVALQKNLTGTVEKYEEEISVLKQNTISLSLANQELEKKYSLLLGDRPTPTGSSGDGEQSTSLDSIKKDISPLEAEIDKLFEAELNTFLDDLKLSLVTDDFSEDVIPKDPIVMFSEHCKTVKSRMTSTLIRNLDSLLTLVDKDDTARSRTGSVIEEDTETGLKVETQKKKITELQLKLDTEAEENRLLKEQLQKLQNSHKSESTSKSDEVAKLSEKVKKKQESIVQLQNEKEDLYNDMRKKLEDLQNSKEKDVTDLMEQKGRIQSQLAKSDKTLTEYQAKIQVLENTVATLNDQVVAQGSLSVGRMEQLQSENNNLVAELQSSQQLQNSSQEEVNKLKAINGSLKNQLETQQENNSKITTEKEELQGQMSEVLGTNSRLSEEIKGIQNDRDNLHKDLQESNKIAEKRKSMLDDLAIQMQTIKQQNTKEIEALTIKYKDEFDDLTKTHEEEMNKLQEQLTQEQERRAALEPLRDEVTKLNEEVQSLTSSKGWFERRLQETEEELKKVIESHEQEIVDLNKKMEDQDIEFKEELNKEKIVLQESEEKCGEIQKKIEELKQHAIDSIEERKISEKKGIATVKDLKRQLKMERKRAEKLQERLQQVLADASPSRLGLDDLLQIPDYESRQKFDNSSVSSWSQSGAGTSFDATQSPDVSVVAGSLSDETTELIARITELQQCNWTLEEKVRHLEESNAAMADDLLKKTAIIGTHVMERRTIDPSKTVTPEKKMPLRKMMNFVKGVEEGDNMKEMNHKLQIMLEETLTKNMHLQENLEMLSTEVSRLSQSNPSSQSQKSANGMP